MKFKHNICLLALLIVFSCQSDNKTEKTKTSKTLFTLLSQEDSGVGFRNDIKEDKNINFYRYQYLYNGGGVGIGDINNDGLPDLYFTSTQGFDKLYLNEGGLKFKDISASAGVNKFPGYKTGVNMIDINQDGWLDIYVCRSGWTNNPKLKENLLFINQKDNTFKEQSASYKLNDGNQSIQSTFLDYDKDGDLDVYISNHPEGFNQPMVNLIESLKNPQLKNSDRLFRNDGNQNYVDVTKASGILNFGYGLGTSACDFNNDGWTDIYVTSDFSPRDLYYVNQQDGTFKESLKEFFPHASYFAMGVDATDINNDGSMDLFVGEMLAEDNKRQKTNMAPMDMERFAILASNNMYYQYMRNSFFINSGNGHFSDVANYAGVDQTDWSWSVLFGDYDLDTDDDLLVANGWLKDTQDKDFSNKSNALASQSKNRISFEQVSALLKSTPISNYAFEYGGDLKFKKVSKDWGFDTKGFSNGMSTGDLDNDGDLDVVINNMNGVASIYKNNTNQSNYLKIKLKGQKGNLAGLNSKVSLYQDQNIQHKEFQVSRGFQSSVDPLLHFGLKGENIDSIKITWSNGQSQKVTGLKGGQTLIINQNNAGKGHNKNNVQVPNYYDLKSNVDLNSPETFFDDYKVQVLLPHMFSQLGPSLATGDLNGDGLEDIFLGGTHNNASKILLHNKNGSFIKSNASLLEEDKKYEDIEAIFFDANNDGHLDIYVGSGSNEFIEKPELNEDRIYINNGKGQFKKGSKIDIEHGITGCIAAYDYDGDGFEDIFLGSRVKAGAYPNPPASFILKNNDGVFIDVTSDVCPGLKNIGMLNAANWEDLDNDGDADIIIAGEWTDILYLENNNNKFEIKSLLSSKKVGWWNCISIADLDNDGLNDILLGNLGTNYKYEANDNAPFEIFSDDFDNSGNTDIVLGYHQDDQLYPVRGLQCSSEQLPELKSKFKTYDKFGSSNLFQVYGESIQNALHYQANSFESAILWNKGAATYSYEALPYQAQLSPIQDFETIDIDGDGDLDIVAAGNWFVSEIETPRADSGQGVVFENEGNRKIKSLPFSKSGFLAKGDVRHLAILKNNKQENLVLVANNNGPLEAFIIGKKQE